MLVSPGLCQSIFSFPTPSDGVRYMLNIHLKNTLLKYSLKHNDCRWNQLCLFMFSRIYLTIKSLKLQQYVLI